jgi:DNA polymerase-3 subunit gamma/tau
MSLYRKYRPHTWADVVGQEQVTKPLAWQVANGKASHAYLFAGPRGVGKTTCARILARAVNCPARAPGSGEPCGECANCHSVLEGTALDVVEIDAASNRGIDVVREVIIENARFAPSSLAYKVFVLDEAHMLTTEAWNALLKTLEEPSGRVIFVLATTELHKVPATVQSRCQRYDFARLSTPVLVERLVGLARKEGVEADDRVIRAIAKAADGCARDAESLLGQALTAARDGKLAYEDAASVLPLADGDAPARFLAAALANDPATALAEVAELSRRGSDLAAFHDATATLCRDALAWALAGDRAFPGIDDAARQSLVELATAGTGRIAAALDTLVTRRRLSSVAPDPSLPLALVVADLSGVMPAAAPKAAAPTPGKPTPPVTKVPVMAAASAPAQATAAPAASPASTETVHAQAPETVVAPVQVAPVVAVTPATSAAPAAPSSVGPVVALEKLVSSWVAIVRKVGELQPSLSFVLSTATPYEVRGDQFFMGVGFPFHRDKANEEKNRLALERAVLAVLGVAIRVEAVHLEQTAPVGHDQGAPAEALAVPASTTVANLEAVFS